MKCPECGKEMRDGYLFCSKDGAFSFASEVPGVFENAKKADGFVKITELKPGQRTKIAASICEECPLNSYKSDKATSVTCSPLPATLLSTPPNKSSNVLIFTLEALPALLIAKHLLCQ